MKTLEIELPDALAEKLAELVKAGWFTSEDEIVRLALAELLGRHRFELQEQFQREDIAWAREQKRKEGRRRLAERVKSGEGIDRGADVLKASRRWQR